MKTRSARTWDRLGAAGPGAIVEARLQAHYACQFVSVFGEAYVNRKEDSSHIGMTFGSARRALMSGVALGPRRVRMALDFQRFELYALEPVGEWAALDRFNLMGATLESASKWLRKTSARFGFDPETLNLDFDGMPDHPLKHGGSFSFEGDEAEMVELGRYFSNAIAVMGRVCSTVEGCSLIHIWPGQFDAAAVYSFTGSPGEKHTIGMGMSPGGDFSPQPYFYANIFPSPDPRTLPPAPAPGIWRAEGRWTGAVLPAEEIVKLTSAEAQLELTERFLTESVALLRGI